MKDCQYQWGKRKESWFTVLTQVTHPQHFSSFIQWILRECFLIVMHLLSSNWKMDYSVYPKNSHLPATKIPYFTHSRCGGSRGPIRKAAARMDAGDGNTLVFESRFQSGNLQKAVQTWVFLFLHMAAGASAIKCMDFIRNSLLCDVSSCAGKDLRVFPNYHTQLCTAMSWETIMGQILNCKDHKVYYETLCVFSNIVFPIKN